MLSLSQRVDGHKTAYSGGTYDTKKSCICFLVETSRSSTEGKIRKCTMVYEWPSYTAMVI